ncbi:hypothetical protein BC629DRAFT_1462429 [Irpex lacteus]|nr:hypothetical protein BC629DRAFT_1462429 [Irpex lacteus]
MVRNRHLLQHIHLPSTSPKLGPTAEEMRFTIAAYFVVATAMAGATILTERQTCGTCTASVYRGRKESRDCNDVQTCECIPGLELSLPPQRDPYVVCAGVSSSMRVPDCRVRSTHPLFCRPVCKIPVGNGSLSGHRTFGEGITAEKKLSV